ncbi:MAG: hypothetical protein R2832_08635 [Rhodothermales bacterium]
MSDLPVFFAAVAAAVFVGAGETTSLVVVQAASDSATAAIRDTLVRADIVTAISWIDWGKVRLREGMPEGMKEGMKE